MSPNRNYSAFARRFSLRYPLISFVSIQVSFWLFANVLLGVILYLHSLLVNQLNFSALVAPLSTILFSSVILGLTYGSILGLTDYYLDRSVLRRRSLGNIILIKVAFSFSVLIMLIAVVRYIHIPGFNIDANNSVWGMIFCILSFYYMFMTVLISFINQVNRKYGPGILIPMLLGKYRTPREEERIFMFMDLKGSTTIAENLGHLKYSSFIRDSFMDINFIVSKFYAEIYQYVGDEIVITWGVKEGLADLRCIQFFFACEKVFKAREEYYLSTYGCLPVFKAGIHLGTVVAVEIGDIKRDIAYHGDTLNTAARIQSLCNQYQKKILISETMLTYISNINPYKIEHLGTTSLRGKSENVGIASIEN